MKLLKYVLIAAVVIGLIVPGAGCLGQPAKPESEEVDYYGQCLASAVRVEGDEVYIYPMRYLSKAVYVEGTVTDFRRSGTLEGYCTFCVVDEDGWKWHVDTLGVCPGVESNCLWLFEGRKVKVWGYITIGVMVSDDVFIPEIDACEIEKR